MTVNFKFSIELEAIIQDTNQEDVNRKLYERVRRLAQKVAADKERMVDVYKIVFFDLLLSDYYSDDIYEQMGLKKEKNIILPVTVDMSPKDSSFFKSLFKEPLDESLSETKDEVLNLFYSQFGNPTIMDARLECTRIEFEDRETLK